MRCALTIDVIIKTYQNRIANNRLRSPMKVSKRRSKNQRKLIPTKMSDTTVNNLAEKLILLRKIFGWICFIAPLSKHFQ